MSINAFSPTAFPALRNVDSDAAVRARAAGHAAGYASGQRAASEELAERRAHMEEEHAAMTAAGRAEVANAVAVLQAAAEALNRRTVPLLTEAQDAIAATAMELAEAIIGRELSVAETSAGSALHRALSGVDLDLVHSVRMHPEDLAVLGADVLAAATVTFVPDAALARGDAVTEFPNGYLDARVATAIQRAKAAIAEEGQ